MSSIGASENTLTQIIDDLESIERAVDGLSDEEYGEFRHWFLERDWNEWDRQIAVKQKKTGLREPWTTFDASHYRPVQSG